MYTFTSLTKIISSTHDHDKIEALLIFLASNRRCSANDTSLALYVVSQFKIATDTFRDFAILAIQELSQSTQGIRKGRQDSIESICRHRYTD